MFAVVQIGSKQFQVNEGDQVSVSKLKGSVGDELTFDQVLLINDGKATKVGKPFVDGAKVSAKIVAQTKQKKVSTYKYRLRKNSATKTGCRPKATDISVTKIEG